MVGERFLALMMMWWLLTAGYYWVATRCVGTPLKDSLTPAQVALKEKSQAVRRRIFWQGGLGSIVAMWLAHQASRTRT